MTFKYFNDCSTAEEGKKLYHTLAKRYHSDNGGNDQILREINDEFRAWWKIYKNVHTAADGTTYKKETAETAEEFIEILSKLSRHQGLKVDLCGSWLWISGATFGIRDQLASYGCHWSRGHRKWFWCADVKKKSGRGHYSEDEITMMHGRKEVKLEYNPVYTIE